MKRLTKQWLSVTAAGLVLAAGCAAGPQRSPNPTSPGAGKTAGSTTGDMDACAVALGNMVAAGGAPAAKGTTPGAAGTETPAPGTTPGTTATTPPGTPGTPGAAGTTTGAAVEITANGVLLGNVALIALPSMDNMGTTTGMNTGPGPVGVPGAGNTTGGRAPAGTTGAGQDLFRGNTTAIDKIRAACTNVTEIRVVGTDADRSRLAEITQTIRQGAPITAYLDEISAMSRRATTAWTGGAAGAAGGPTGTAGGTTGAPVSPGTAGTTPGGTMGR